MKHFPWLLMIAVLVITSSAWGQSPEKVFSLTPSVPTAPDAAAPADRPLFMLVEAPPVVAPPESHPWEFTLSIPLWLPGIDGDVTVRGRDLNLSQDTGDAIDAFDSHINGAFALHVEGQKDRFGMLVDVMYVNLRAEGNRDATDATGTLEGFIGELGAFYTVIAPEKKRGWGAFRLDALGGLRVTELEFGIDSNVGDTSARQTVYDPYVGLRMELGLTQWLSLKARGDVGGFGIESWPTSDFSYNLEGGFEFHIAQWFDLGIGYRALSYEFDGNSPNSKFDATLHGPVVTLKFNF